MTNLNNQQVAKEQMTYWITEGTAVRGWFTCEKTGKKFRGEKATEQFKAQQEAIDEAAEQEFLESDEASDQAEAENKQFAAIINASINHDEDKASAKALIEAVAGKPMVEQAVKIVTNPIEAGAMPDATPKLVEHVEIQIISGKPMPTLTTIACVDCGASRTIKVQDVFQVKRCEDCQKKHRNTLRSQRRKEKLAQAEAGNEPE